jgi:hypothetical protein
MTIEIGTVGTCRGVANEAIVVATHENKIWVKDRVNNAMLTAYVGDFTPAPVLPRTLSLGEDGDFVELTPKVIEALRAARVDVEKEPSEAVITNSRMRPGAGTIRL